MGCSAQRWDRAALTRQRKILSRCVVTASVPLAFPTVRITGCSGQGADAKAPPLQLRFLISTYIVLLRFHDDKGVIIFTFVPRNQVHSATVPGFTANFTTFET